MGGRGAGKTRTGAEWIAEQVRRGVSRIAIVGETYQDAREVMIEGHSGLREVGLPQERPTYESSRHRLVWPNGAQANVFSADDPDGLRGHQFEIAWSDELCKWRYPDAAWSNLQLGLRLGDRPRQVVTTTPRPQALLRTLLENSTTAVTRTSTYENAENLAESFLTEVASTYAGTRLGRQELLGELLDDTTGALWTWGMVESSRSNDLPPLDRLVVAVDPPVTSGPNADECGLIVAGVRGTGQDAHGYVITDASVAGLGPMAWARRACELKDQYGADRIIAEVNQGGDLVEQMIRFVDANAPFRAVRASRGKIARAEPVAALYEQGRIHHIGTFPDLEDQMTAFTGAANDDSPDRLDALVWAMTDLMLGPAHREPSIHAL